MRRRRFGSVRPGPRQVKSDPTTVALSTSRSFEVGQTVYAEYHDSSGCKRPDQHKDKACGGYWYDSWEIEKVGPRRLLVCSQLRLWSGYDEFKQWQRTSEGYVNRQFLTREGWGIAYGSWRTPVAVIVLERSKEWEHETLGFLLFREKQLLTLGLKLEDDGNKELITKAYRILAQKHHPDVGGDPEEFKRVQTAYDDLMNISMGDQLKRIMKYAGEELRRRQD